MTTLVTSEEQWRAANMRFCAIAADETQHQLLFAVQL